MLRDRVKPYLSSYPGCNGSSPPGPGWVTGGPAKGPDLGRCGGWQPFCVDDPNTISGHAAMRYTYVIDRSAVAVRFR